MGAWLWQEVKHHPASVDLELIKRLAATTKAQTLQAFLIREFSCISKEHAGTLRPSFLPSFLPHSQMHWITLCRNTWRAYDPKGDGIAVPQESTSLQDLHGGTSVCCWKTIRPVHPMHGHGTTAQARRTATG